MAGLDTIKQATSLGAIGDDNNQAGGGWDSGTSGNDVSAWSNGRGGVGDAQMMPRGEGAAYNDEAAPTDIYDYHAPGKEAPIDRYAHTVNPDGSFSTQPPGFASPINQAQYSSLTSATPPDKRQQAQALSAQNESPAMQAIKAGMPDYRASNVVRANAAVTPQDKNGRPLYSQGASIPQWAAQTAQHYGDPIVMGGQVPTTGAYVDASGRLIVDGSNNDYESNSDYVHPRNPLFRDPEDAPVLQQAAPAAPVPAPTAAAGTGLPPNATPTQKIQAGLTQQAANPAGGAPATSAAPATGGTTQLGSVLAGQPTSAEKTVTGVPTVAQALAMGQTFEGLQKTNPDIVKQYLDALPPPNRIVGRAWNDLGKDTQAFLLSGYEQLGYSANDVLDAIDKNSVTGGESGYWSPDFTSTWKTQSRTPMVTG